MISKVAEKIKRYVNYIPRLMYKTIWMIRTHCTKTISNQILFRTYQDGYACNPKYLCEEFLRRNTKCKMVWVYSDKTKHNLEQFPSDVTLVKFGTYAYYQALAESKVWINNAHNFTWEYFPKKNQQILINLWHGSLGLKRIDPQADQNRKRQKAGKRAGQITDYCITNSEFEEMVFRTSYWPNTKYLRFGHCRNDLMFADFETVKAIKMRVAERFGFDYDKKILLYAPTFREGVSTDCFNIDYERLKYVLEKRFGGEWVILSRFHFQTRLRFNEELNIHKEKTYVICADDYEDVQELIAVSDIGVTDYSSWICDFVLTGRPGFLFVTDRESYVTERGFYYPLEDTPFAICENNDELVQKIILFEQERYDAQVRGYLERLGCMEDGKASKRLKMWLENIIVESERSNVMYR